MDIQDKLRNKIRPKIVTAKSIAKLCGMDNSHFSRWLNGSDVNNTTLNKIIEGTKQLK
jgi:predicted transcriptional regulator